LELITDYDLVNQLPP
jgi:hypothetical protein